MKQLVKVVGTSISGAGGGRLETTMARGIVPLRRTETIIDFIKNFLTERGVTTFTLNQRDETTWATSPIMYLTTEPKHVFTYCFSQFPISELGYHCKDLTKAEQERDLKALRRYLNG